MKNSLGIVLMTGQTICLAFGLGQKRFERFAFHVLDGKDKEDGIYGRWFKALNQSNGRVSPYEGTKVILDHFGIGEDLWKERVAFFSSLESSP